MSHYVDRLNAVVASRGNPVLVGMDPRIEQLPPGFASRFESTHEGRAEAAGAFCDAVLDVVGARVPAVKFQSAFYECFGPEGMVVLGRLMRKARRLGLIVIFDGKRNDIGTTAAAYAEAYLAGDQPAWEADAMTVNPYLGGDGVEPFADLAARQGKGVYVLVRTSNPSARDLQDLVADGRPIYRHVAEKVVEWGTRCLNAEEASAIGAVVGATYPAELAELRDAMPGVPFLIPGYGAQGGGAADVAPAFDARGFGALVNNSRGILFAFAKAGHRERFGDDWEASIDWAVTEMIEDLVGHGIGSGASAGH